MSRRRRGGALDPFGLSFLDLVSCAFAGVLILYLTADDSREAEEREDPSSLVVVEAQVADGVPAELGLRVRSGSKEWSSWEPADDAARWVRSAGRTTWLYSGTLDAPIEIDVIARSLPRDQLGRPLGLRLLRDGQPETTLELRPETLYRYAWSP